VAGCLPSLRRAPPCSYGVGGRAPTPKTKPVAYPSLGVNEETASQRDANGITGYCLADSASCNSLWLRKWEKNDRPNNTTLSKPQAHLIELTMPLAFVP
jgi:hypothetical protein